MLRIMTSGKQIESRPRNDEFSETGRYIAMRVMLLKLIGAVAFAAAVAPLYAAEPTAVGLWEQVDEKSGQAESWFRITERNGVYEGAIVKIFFKPGEDPNWVCDRCEGAERGAPVLGLTLIKGMHRNGLKYDDGTIIEYPRRLRISRADAIEPRRPQAGSARLSRHLVVRAQPGMEQASRQCAWKLRCARATRRTSRGAREEIRYFLSTVMPAQAGIQ